MVSWLCSCWGNIWAVVLLGLICADPGLLQQYKIYSSHATFDEALAACDPDNLTTLATTEEAKEILKLISASLQNTGQKQFNFWVGLKKAKTDCVVDTLPLKGFKWTADGSQRSEVAQWRENPQPTCTGVRCAALLGKFNGLSAIDWGLVSVSCNKRHHFICKSTVSQTAGGHDVLPAEPTTSATTLPPKSATPTPQVTTLEPSKAQHQPSAQPKPGPEPGSESCSHTYMPGVRALTLDPENHRRIKVECWSGVQLELHCSGRPATWQLNGSTVDFSTVCSACRNGFKRDTSGNCVDINECISDSAPCRYHCLNTEGSYKCICYDQHGNHHNEDSSVCADMTSLNLTNRPRLQGNQSTIPPPPGPTVSDGQVITTDGDDSLSNILFLVLIAVLVLVVLVVIIAVAVKCCLMRRTKKRAMKKAEKMAMKNKDVAGEDSFERTSEKAAT